MRVLAIMAVLTCAVSAFLAEETPPPWAAEDFTAPASEVFSAGKNAILALHYDIKQIDGVNRTISFHVGATMMSWGYDMVLRVTELGADKSHVDIDISRTGGKAMSWGSGRGEVEKIFNRMNHYLKKSPARQHSSKVSQGSENTENGK